MHTVDHPLYLLVVSHTGHTMTRLSRAVAGIFTTSMVAWVLCRGGTKGTRLHGQDVPKYASHHTDETIVEISFAGSPCKGCGHQGNNARRRTQEEPSEDDRVAGMSSRIREGLGMTQAYSSA